MKSCTHAPMRFTSRHRPKGPGKRPLRHALVGASAALFLLMDSSSAQRLSAAAIVGYVADLEGQWFIAGSPPARLAKGTTISEGASLFSSSSGGFVTLAGRDAQVFYRRACNSSGECGAGQPVPSPAAAAADSSLAALWGLVVERYFAEPARYLTGLSKGPGVFRDAVAELQDGALDLSPAFRPGAADGNYRIELIPLFPEHLAKPRPAVTVRRSHQRAEPLKLAVLPGLYRLLPYDQDGSEPLGPDDEAWLLVAAGSEFVQVSGQFERVEAATATWGDAVRPAARQEFLRATLDQLSSVRH